MSILDDKISKPAAGRYFPIAVAELVSRVGELSFTVHSHKKRLTILIQNCAVECERGHQLCSFLRMSYLAVFSLPVLVPPAITRQGIDLALEEFSKVDQGPHLRVRDQQFVMYRAFLGPLGALSVTQHIVSAGSRSYLQFRNASQLSKAERSCKGQLELMNAQIA